MSLNPAVHDVLVINKFFLDLLSQNRLVDVEEKPESIKRIYFFLLLSKSA